MSTVTVQLFASYAEAFGTQQLEVSLDQGSTVADLLRRIKSLPEAHSLLPPARVAVNRRFVAADKLLGSADEIALIPPVAGG
jgi:molybdopterin converting factor subunit 1